MSNIKSINTMNNIRAEKFDMEAFNEVVKNLRNTHKAVTDFGKDRPEAETRLAEVKVEIQAALDVFDTDAVAKLNAEGKRLVAKLSELPTEKIVAFDTAINAFHKFVSDTASPVALAAVNPETPNDKQTKVEAA